MEKHEHICVTEQALSGQNPAPSGSFKMTSSGVKDGHGKSSRPLQTFPWQTKYGNNTFP